MGRLEVAKGRFTLNEEYGGLLPLFRLLLALSAFPTVVRADAPWNAGRWSRYGSFQSPSAATCLVRIGCCSPSGGA